MVSLEQPRNGRDVCDTQLLAAGIWASLGTTPRGKAFLKVLVSLRPGPEAIILGRPPAREISQYGDAKLIGKFVWPNQLSNRTT